MVLVDFSFIKSSSGFSLFFLVKYICYDEKNDTYIHVEFNEVDENNIIYNNC